MIVTYKTDDWEKALKAFNKNRPLLSEVLARKRNLDKIPVKLPSGKPLELSLGGHNVLQKFGLPTIPTIWYISTDTNFWVHTNDKQKGRTHNIMSIEESP